MISYKIKKIKCIDDLRVFDMKNFTFFEKTIDFFADLR